MIFKFVLHFRNPASPTLRSLRLSTSESGSVPIVIRPNDDAATVVAALLNRRREEYNITTPTNARTTAMDVDPDEETNSSHQTSQSSPEQIQPSLTINGVGSTIGESPSALLMPRTTSSMRHDDENVNAESASRQTINQQQSIDPQPSSSGTARTSHPSAFGDLLPPTLPPSASASTSTSGASTSQQRDDDRAEMQRALETFRQATDAYGRFYQAGVEQLRQRLQAHWTALGTPTMEDGESRQRLRAALEEDMEALALLEIKFRNTNARIDNLGDEFVTWVAAVKRDYANFFQMRDNVYPSPGSSGMRAPTLPDFPRSLRPPQPMRRRRPHVDFEDSSSSSDDEQTPRPSTPPRQEPARSPPPVQSQELPRQQTSPLQPQQEQSQSTAAPPLGSSTSPSGFTISSRSAFQPRQMSGRRVLGDNRVNRWVNYAMYRPLLRYEYMRNVLEARRFVPYGTSTGGSGQSSTATGNVANLYAGLMDLLTLVNFSVNLLGNLANTQSSTFNSCREN